MCSSKSVKKYFGALLVALLMIVVGWLALLVLGWANSTDPLALYGVGLVSGLVGTASWEYTIKRLES